MADTCDVPSTNENRTHAVNEVSHRIDEGKGLCPVGHASDRGEESAEKDETDHTEPHDKHRLLHRITIVGYDQTQTAHDKGHKDGEQIDERKWSGRGNAIDCP